MSNLMTALVHAPVEKIAVPSGQARIVAYASGLADPQAPTIVFLHAGVCDSRMWADQFNAFGATHRVVAFDRRGFGATTAVDEQYVNVHDLWAVLDAFQIERAILVGCSQGGRVALDATLARPERVSALVLVAAAVGGAPEVHYDDPRIDALIAANEMAKAANDLEEQNRIEAHVWLDGPFVEEGRVKGARRDLFLKMNRIAKHAPKIGTTEPPDSAYANLARIAAPTLIVWGPHDVPSVVVNMRHAAATIPGARACELDGVAHLPSLEVPERFNAALASFLHDVAHD
jgi:pimeloyl-ACP methyl ester carboxylesterase